MDGKDFLTFCSKIKEARIDVSKDKEIFRSKILILARLEDNYYYSHS